MKTKTLFPLFFILIIVISLFIPISVFGSPDVYGNHLWLQGIYQNAQETGSFDNATYSENMNITITNYLWNNFQFMTTTILNTTALGDGGHVDTYQGVGIQIFDEDLNSIYASGISPSPPILYDPDPFEFIVWFTEVIELDISETINYVNITLWHNYLITGDIEDFELTESWKFNLVAKNIVSPPPQGDMSFTDLYLLGFIACLFLCPLSIVGAIRQRKAFFVKLAIFFGVGLFIFFCLVMTIRPFGG